jgi:hypothetical protein
MNPQQLLCEVIAELIKPHGIVGIIFIGLITILIVLWMLLPLAIYPLYGAIRSSNRQLQLLNIKIDQIVKNQIEQKELL